MNLQPINPPQPGGLRAMCRGCDQFGDVTHADLDDTGALFCPDCAAIVAAVDTAEAADGYIRSALFCLQERGLAFRAQYWLDYAVRGGR